MRNNSYDYSRWFSTEGKKQKKTGKSSAESRGKTKKKDPILTDDEVQSELHINEEVWQLYLAKKPFEKC